MGILTTFSKSSANLMHVLKLLKSFPNLSITPIDNNYIDPFDYALNAVKSLNLCVHDPY